MKIDLPPQMYGSNPAGLIEYLGLNIQHRPAASETVCEVSARSTALVEAQTLHGPALKRRRFDISKAPTPGIPGGMSPELSDQFQRLTRQLDENPTLSARLERITNTLIVVADHQVPDAIRWGSDMLARPTLEHADGTTEPLFPRHSVHDIRVDPIAYRWSKLPQIFLRLKHNTPAEVIASSKAGSCDVVVGP